MELHEMKSIEGNGGPAAVTESDNSIAPKSSGSHNDQLSADQDIAYLSNWKFFTVLVSVSSACILAGYVSSTARGCAGSLQGTTEVFSRH